MHQWFPDSIVMTSVLYMKTVCRIYYLRKYIITKCHSETRKLRHKFETY